MAALGRSCNGPKPLKMLMTRGVAEAGAGAIVGMTFAAHHAQKHL
jgi:hypothetical protein